MVAELTQEQLIAEHNRMPIANQFDRALRIGLEAIPESERGETIQNLVERQIIRPEHLPNILVDKSVVHRVHGMIVQEAGNDTSLRTILKEHTLTYNPYKDLDSVLVQVSPLPQDLDTMPGYLLSTISLLQRIESVREGVVNYCLESQRDLTLETLSIQDAISLNREPNAVENALLKNLFDFLTTDTLEKTIQS